MENLNLDKSAWKRVKFGDVVVEPKETCRDIHAEGIEHVVGLEHIDSGDMHLRKSATTEESTTFTKKFRKGDVLFGRRRAYLKKAAQADFDGICSGDITVFRANKNLFPELLPFIVNNDKFFDYAIKHSAGGLSPRVKFKDLANYEFLLPPKEEQAKLAELLWAMDEVIEREKGVLEKSEISKSAFIEGLLTGSIKLGKFEKPRQKYRLDELAKYRRGSFPQPYGLQEWYDDINGSPFVQVFDIDYDLKLKDQTKVKISEKAKPMSVFVPKGTLIISIQGSIGRVAVTQYDAYVDRTILIFQNFLKEIDFMYFTYTIQRIFRIAEKTAPGATIKTITKEALNHFEINLPCIEEQKMIGERLSLLNKTVSEIKVKIESTLNLQKSIINQVF
jgi:type I restriction enzyme S subunit